MIATVKSQLPGSIDQKHQEHFLDMLPQIQRQARLAFRRLRSEDREDMIEEVVGNAFCAFARLVRRGKANLAYASPLANFGIRQVIVGRRVGGAPSSHDVVSQHARVVGGIRIGRLDTFDEVRAEWRAALVEDRRATPADVAAARIDVAAWLRSLPPRNRRIAITLATGETTTGAARRFGLSPARVSQLREILRRSWHTFQGGDPLALQA